MNIKKFVLGELETNTYLVNDDNNNAYLVDPAEVCCDISSFIKDNKLVLRGIILTHFHLDHIKGIVQFPDMPIYISKEDAPFLRGDVLDIMKTFYSFSFISEDELVKLKEFVKNCNIVEISNVVCYYQHTGFK